MKTTREPVWLTEHLVFLSEIERTIPFEAKKPLGHTLRGDTWEDDYLMDDSGLAYVSDSGLVVLTGCAHEGCEFAFLDVDGNTVQGCEYLAGN